MSGETIAEIEAIVDAHRVIMAVAINQFDAARRRLEKVRKKEAESNAG